MPGGSATSRWPVTGPPTPSRSTGWRSCRSGTPGDPDDRQHLVRLPRDVDGDRRPRPTSASSRRCRGDPGAVPTERLITLTTCPRCSPRGSGSSSTACWTTGRPRRTGPRPSWSPHDGTHREEAADVRMVVAHTARPARARADPRGRGARRARGLLPWVFPAVAPYMPFNETTVRGSDHDANPGDRQLRLVRLHDRRLPRTSWVPRRSSCATTPCRRGRARRVRRRAVTPGPGTPGRRRRSMQVIRDCADSALPMLGVCLGHQALGEVSAAT